MQWHCFVCRDFLWVKKEYINCNGNVFCVEFILVTATIVIGQRYFVLYVEHIVVKATEDIREWYCYLCGDICGNNNSSYGVMVLCFVWRFCG